MAKGTAGIKHKKQGRALAVYCSNLRNQLSLKDNDILQFEIYHITFYMDNLRPSVSDMINILIL